MHPGALMMCAQLHCQWLTDGFQIACPRGSLVQKAGDFSRGLPVEQPTKFDLILNVTTAKVLGLTVGLGSSVAA